MTTETVGRRELMSVLEAIGAPQVLVLGDFILDRYTWGNAERISPEAPVLVLQADRQESRLGGATAVCYVARGLDVDVVACGVVGDDAGGRQVADLMQDVGIDSVGTVRAADRMTTVKERFIGRAGNRHPQQILRVDHEVREPLDAVLEDELIGHLRAKMATCQALLISDYNKGVCTQRVLDEAIRAARSGGTAVIVDPARVTDYSRYRGATLLTPNRTEAELASGRSILTPEDAFAAGKVLCEQAALDSIIITLDRDGMALVRPDGTGTIFPTQIRSVYDITGAGDMVLATLGMCIAGGTSFDDAVRLANISAGLEVERVGVEQVSRNEIRADLAASVGAGAGKVLPLDAAAAVAESCRRREQKVVFTNGCFDILHHGHMQYLQEAARQGDLLIVGLNSDDSIRRLKGPERPINTQRDRAGLLTGLACVDYVVIFDDDTPHELLRQIRPDILIKGGTYTVDEVVGKEVVEAYGGQVCVAGKVDGLSTTAIVNSLRKAA